VQNLNQFCVLLSPGSVIYDALLLIDDSLIVFAPACTTMTGLLLPKIINVDIFLVDVVDHFV